MSESKLLGPVYAAHLNSIFHQRADDGQTVDFELVKVETKNSSPNHEEFSLIFRGPLDLLPIMQGLFRLEHEKLGTEEIFLVPISKDHEGIYFEAVFNRLF
jgi:hypothetical protein